MSSRPFPATTAWRIALVALLVAITWLALVPAPPEQLSTGWDKANHALAFAALAFTGRLAFPGSWRRAIAAAFAAMTFGGLIEIAQLFLPGHSSEWADMLADLIGVVIGLLAAAAVRSIARRL
ncbi:hypothetical protein BH09PSE5_BH09PSE5_04090 [soil metagenome]